MCGIAGVGNIADANREDAFSRLGRVIGDIRKRGPDGLMLFSERGFALAQTFLLISDQDRGGTPYLSQDGRYIAVVNGQIYNHQELRADERLRGFAMASRSDCDIIANGFAVYGSAFFAKIRGMFAIAILDRVDETLTLARDAQGIRPLYYTRTSASVAFCSEPQPLVHAGLAPADEDERAALEALLLRSPIEPATMYKHIHALPPGHFLTLAERDSRPQPFVEDPFASEPSPMSGSETNQAREVRAGLEDSVSIRVPGSCPYTTFLSGGLDSGIVCALTPRRDPLRQASPSCGFGQAGLTDERLGARRLAARLGIPLRETSLSADRFLAIWPFMLEAMGAPLMFNSTIPIFWMARQARQSGVKVILSGEGADELFLGYPRYAVYAGIRDEGDPGLMLAHDEELDHIPLPVRAALEKDSRSRGLLGGMKERIAEIAPYRDGQSALDRKLRFDRLTFLRALLMRQDRAGLGAAVEIRVPFLDERVVSPARAIPSRHHLAPREKNVLRELFGDVLGPFATIPKLGFPLPLTAWLNTPAFAGISALLGRTWNGDGYPPQLVDALKKPAVGGNGIFAWTLHNLAAWSLLQRSGPRFYEIWHDHLNPSGQSLMRELQREIHPAAPSWLPDLLKRCAAGTEACLSISRHWREPTRLPLHSTDMLIT